MRYKRLIPFVYSSTIAYLVEIGDYYMRFYYDDALITAIETPYPEADIFKLQYHQIADVMRIVIANTHQKKLSRTAVDTFTLEDVDFKNGPFLTRNDLLDPTITNSTELSCSVTTVGLYGNLTATAAVFTKQHIGALFKLIHPVTTSAVSQDGAGTSTAVYIKSGGYFSTQGTWTGTIKIQRSENNVDWEDFKTYTALTSGARNDAYSIKADDAGENGAYFRIYASDATCKATLSTYNVTIEGIVKIVSVSTSTDAVCQVVSTVASTDTTKKWCEGSWSGQRGYPSTIAFIENRCCYAGGTSNSDRSDNAIPQYPEIQTWVF